MKLHKTKIFILVLLLMVSADFKTFAQTYDISSGGQPTISGSLKGSVTGSSSVTQNLVVNINFGDVSPLNSNSIVKVTVPIAIRGTEPYRVSVIATGAGDSNPQAIQLTDIGYGNRNMRVMGGNAKQCSSSHIFNSLFANDPATSATINSNGRVAYPSTIANITTSTVILSGPKLTDGDLERATDNGWIFNAIFAITPQFFAAGSRNMTLTFTISAGPNVSC